MTKLKNKKSKCDKTQKRICDKTPNLKKNKNLKYN